MEPFRGTTYISETTHPRKAPTGRSCAARFAHLPHGPPAARPPSTPKPLCFPSCPMISTRDTERPADDGGAGGQSTAHGDERTWPNRDENDWCKDAKKIIPCSWRHGHGHDRHLLVSKNTSRDPFPKLLQTLKHCKWDVPTRSRGVYVVSCPSTAAS